MQFYKPSIKRNDMQSVLMSMAEEQIGHGKRCKQFEEELRKHLNFKNMLFLRSPVTAFFLCLDSLEIAEGDKVLASCFIPAFYKDLFEEAGVEVVYADVRQDDGCMDLDNLPDLKGIKAVFACGHLGYVPETAFFKEKGLKVLCDLTECIGIEVNPADIDMALISLEDDKIITSAGGAAVMSDSIRFEKPVREELLSDLNVSLSLMQLENYDFYYKKRAEIEETYAKSVEISSNRTFSRYDGEKGNAFRFAVMLDNFKDALNFLERRKIPVRRAFADTAYEELEGKEKFKNASYLYNRVYCFPLYYYMKTDEIELVRKVLAALP